LPVPLAPAKSAVMPSPRDPRLVDLRSLADVDGNLAQQGKLGRGQHQVVPGGDRLDVLGQPLHPRPGQGAAGLPQALLEDDAGSWRALGPQRGADDLDAVGVQVKLGGDAVEPAVERVARRPQGASPECALLAGIAAVDVEPDDRPAAEPDRVAAGDE
jgi:hypothetical protein